MSLLKLKSFLTGLLLAIILATTSPISAEGMRLWAPYQPENFGGSRRNNDGLYATLAGIYWKLDGFGNDYSYRSATKVEVGNVRGHHGWMVGWQGILRGSYSEYTNWDVGDMPIPFLKLKNEVPTIHTYQTYKMVGDEWVPDNTARSFPEVPFYDDSSNMPSESGYYYDRSEDSIFSKTTFMDIDLLYNYRIHPLSWGTIDLFAGAQFAQFDSKYTFSTIEKYDYYYYIISGEEPSRGDAEITDMGEYIGELPWYYEVLEENDNAEVPHIWKVHPNAVEGNDDDTASSSTYNILFKERRNSWRVTNRIVGPKFGVKLQRRNQRWTFGAECYVTTGINTQSRSLNYFDFSGNAPQLVNHRLNKTVFSTITDFRVTARWQWTDAVGIFVGFNTVRSTGIGRSIDFASSINGTSDEAIRNGTAKSKHNVMMYGLSIGFDVRR
jgi:hypothetical protein